MAKKKERMLRVACQCRGEGLGYVAVCSGKKLTGLRATAMLKDGTPVPCKLYAVPSPALRDALAPGSSYVWVLVLPLLGRDCVLRFFCDADDALTTVFHVLQSKVASRLLATTKPELAAILRGFEKKYAGGQAQVTIAEAWPAGSDDVVWRIKVCYPTSSKTASPQLRVYDSSAQEVAAHVVTMEDQIAPGERDCMQLVRLVTFSCRLPLALGSFFVVADLRGIVELDGAGGFDDPSGAGDAPGVESGADMGGVAGFDGAANLDGTAADLDSTDNMVGLDGMNAPRAAGMLDGVRRLTGGAVANDAYAMWFEGHRATPAELARQRRTCVALDRESAPLVSLVALAPCVGGGVSSTCVHAHGRAKGRVHAHARARAQAQGSGKRLCEVADSLLAQSYSRWELVVVHTQATCADLLALPDDERVRMVHADGGQEARAIEEGFAAARGRYVGIVGCDDLLEPDALWRFYCAMLRHPEADLLYSDEDCVRGACHVAPSFKTFPNYGKLYTGNYIGRLMLVSRRALECVGPWQDDVADALEYDLALRVFEVARDVVHVPHVLYHRRDRAGSARQGQLLEPGREPEPGNGHTVTVDHEAGRRALQAHLVRRGITAHVESGPVQRTYRVRYELPSPVPLVSIVIPTRDQAALLKTCVTSILHKTTYPAFEVVLVENNSADPQTFALYDELAHADERVRVVTWTSSEPGAFNYSAIVNYGVSCSAGELVVLLNNDTEVIEPRWLEEMAGCLMRPEAGVVGAKLLFGDGLIQHVGMVANPGGDFCHVCQNLPPDVLGPGYAVALPGDYSMVTGACQMVRRSLFDELGGYDENLAVGFNDGDFCLRVGEAGYAVAVCAEALLHHREFSSRGRERTDVRLRQRFLHERALMTSKHAAFFAKGDPALNPNLDPYGWYFNLA